MGWFISIAKTNKQILHQNLLLSTTAFLCVHNLLSPTSDADCSSGDGALFTAINGDAIGINYPLMMVYCYCLARILCESIRKRATQHCCPFTFHVHDMTHLMHKCINNYPGIYGGNVCMCWCHVLFIAGRAYEAHYHC